MSRTVVSFQLVGTDTVVTLEDAPIDVPGMLDGQPCDVSPLPGGDVRTRGEALLARLQVNPSVRAGLDHLLATPPAGGPSPLYFHVIARSADELPWEQLYSATHGFCALDQRWPMGRIARRRRSLSDRTFTPPLSVVAVLSAAGQSGVGQLDALLDATVGPDATAVGVRLHVISGETAVLDRVAAVTTAGRTGVTAEAIAGTAAQVARQVSAAAPHVLHLLCHGGQATPGVRTLALATLADFDAGEQTGSVRLKVADLVIALRSADPWLVVLAACESAEAVDGPALAHDIVDSGVPAVIGMRRLVDLHATNRFCAALYPEVLATVRAAVDPDGPPGVRVVDWVNCLTGPRTALGGADPVAVDAWSDPVLYVQEDPLRVFPPSPRLSPDDYAELRAQLDLWESYLRSQDPTTASPGLMAEVHEKVQRLTALLGEAAG